MLSTFLALALAVAPPPSPRIISVAGDARLTFRPNQALVTFVLQVSQQRDAANARKASDEKVSRFMKAIAQAGVTTANVVLADGAAQPEYRGNEIASYSMSRVANITVTDLSKLDEVLTAGVKSGALPSGNVTLQATDHDVYETKARIAAAAAARERAKALTETLGAKLGLLVSVSDSTPVVESISAGAFVANADGVVTTGFGSKLLAVTSHVTVQFDIDAP